LDIDTTGGLLEHHISLILVLKVLDGTFFDISDAKSASLVDIHSCRVLIVALTLIVLVNDHLRFFL